MTGDGSRRKGRRRGTRGAVTPTVTAAPSPRDDDTEWRWRTFPVGFAFVLGAFVMAGLILIAPGAFYILLVTALFFLIFGIAHYFGRALRDYRRNDEEV